MAQHKVARGAFVWMLIAAGALLSGCSSGAPSGHAGPISASAQVRATAAPAGARPTAEQVTSVPAPDQPSPAPSAVVEQPTAIPTSEGLVGAAVGADAQPLAGPTAAVLQQEAQSLNTNLQQTPVVQTEMQDCQGVLDNYPICQVLQHIQPIVRPEWQAVFPKTMFFAVDSVPIVNAGGSAASLAPAAGESLILARQDGKIYTFKDFQELLRINNIVVTDQNQQPVMKAYILMTLGKRSADEVQFTGFEKADVPLVGSIKYTVRAFVWTKIQGLRLSYLFAFNRGNLVAARGSLHESKQGDYVDIPEELLRLPAAGDMNM